ncbi:MAG: phosphohistidine phosphatase [Myxococcota bacterium]
MAAALSIALLALPISMPRLLLLRHAKSAWGTDVASDHDRPLNKRGQRNAPAMGVRLAEAGWVPDVVLCSTATRTRQTWAAMEDLAPDVVVTFLPKLYLTGPRAALPLLAEQTAETVMLVGHNPGFETLASVLSGIEVQMTTCNAALLTSTAADWARAVEGTWTLEDLLRPRKPRS